MGATFRRKTDFLVIGSGIAGLSFAIKAASHGKVCMITKSDEDESNTKYAQGGIAAVTEATDSFEKHIADTLTAGDGLCNEDVVKMVITEAPERIEELIRWGTSFDKMKKVPTILAKKVGIPNTEFCTTKTIQVMKLKGHCSSKFATIQTLKYLTIILQLKSSLNIIWGCISTAPHPKLTALEFTPST
jgi:succinate dehydrogenase/fumarate reductase flavoprotein subunit